MISALRAVLVRELRSAVLNRYLQVFSVLALAGGIAAVSTAESPDAALYFLAQIALFFVSLFALLVGVSTARAETEEWPLLFAQPAPRWSSATGKLVALTAMFGAFLLLLFAPVFYVGEHERHVVIFYLQTIGLAAVFGSLGIFIGYVSRDRVQGLLIAATAWLILLFAFDLIALLAAHAPPLQKNPDVWVAMLMVNPLDAFRIHAMFALDKVPPEAAGKTVLAGWWLSNPGQWLAILSAGWTLGLLSLTNWRVSRMEI